ncbi:MAG: signal peptidase II [Geothermobacteraceae bacterium]
MQLSRYGILLAVTLVVGAVDQWTKYLVLKSFRLYESVPVIDGLFNLTYVRNKGAAFGILADSDWRRPFFIVVTLVACAFILGYLRRLGNERRLAPLSLSLIFAGALGNLIDRVRFGEVIDFLDVYWRQYHWPAFNVADSAITVGVGLLLLDMWRHDRQCKEERQ